MVEENVETHPKISLPLKCMQNIEYLLSILLFSDRASGNEDRPDWLGSGDDLERAHPLS